MAELDPTQFGAVAAPTELDPTQFGAVEAQPVAQPAVELDPTQFGAKPAEGPGFVTQLIQHSALDPLKEFGAPIVGGIVSLPRSLEEAVRGGIRGAARGDVSSVMAPGAYIPGVDTDETVYGPETEEQKAHRQLVAERTLKAIPQVPGLKPLADIGHKAQTSILNSISPGAKKALQDSQITGNIFKGEIDFGKNPSLEGYALQTVNIFGSMAPVIVGTMVTKNPETGALIGGGMAADEAIGNAVQAINSLDDKQLAQQSPFFAQMMKGGATAKEARDLTLRKAAETGAALQGVVGMFGDDVLGRFVSGAFDKALTKFAGKSILAHTAVGTGLAAAEQGLSETAEGVASDVANKSVLPSTELGQGSAANFVGGMLGGLPAGAGRGFVTGLNAKLQPDPNAPAGTPKIISPIDFGAVEDPATVTDREAAVKQETQRLMSQRGFSEEVSRGMAEKSIPLAAFAEETNEPEEEENVAGPNAEPAGTSVSVPTGTDTTATTGGAGEPERNGVVSNQQNVAAPVAGERVEQPAINPLPKEEFEEKYRDLTERINAYNKIDPEDRTPRQNANLEEAQGLLQNLVDAQGYFTPPPQAASVVPTVNANEPIQTPEGPVEHANLYAANEFSNEVTPEEHAGVNQAAAIEDNPQAAYDQAVKDAAAAKENFNRLDQLFKFPDITAEEQVTQEQRDEAKQQLDDALLKADQAQAALEEAQAAAKEAARQRAPGAGRKPAELTPEQQAAKAKIAADEQAAKAEVEKARRGVKKAEAFLSEGLAPLTEEQMKDPKGQAFHENDKTAMIDEATRMLADIVDNRNLRNRPIGKRAKEILQNNNITAEDIKRARAKKAASEKAIEDLYRQKRDLLGSSSYDQVFGPSSMSASNVGQSVPAFSGNKTATQAISTIMKFGDEIQRYFANHLRGFVKDVKFVVLEVGDELPPQLKKYQAWWDLSRGLYIPENGNKTIYVRGESFGPHRGNDITTVLHELIHAASVERIYVGQNSPNNTELSRAVASIDDMRERAAKVFEAGKRNRLLSQDLINLIQDVPDIFTNNDEFVAYGLSQPEMQKFLMSMPSDPKHFTESMFNRFTRGLMNILGLNSSSKERLNAFTDLAMVTDKVLQAKYTNAERAIAQKYRETPMQASPATQREMFGNHQRINLSRLKADTLGHKTPEQQIKFFENAKAELDAELAKGDAGRFNANWARDIGSSNMPKGQAIAQRAQLAAKHVEALKEHYDDVINEINRGVVKAPSPSAKRSEAVTEAKKIQAVTTEGLKAVQTSREGNELGKAVSVLQQVRHPNNLWGEINLILSSGNEKLNDFLSSFYDADGLARSGPNLQISALQDIYKNMQLMNGTTQRMLSNAANEIDALQTFYRENPSLKKPFEDFVNATTFDKYNPLNPKEKGTPKAKVYDEKFKQLGPDGQAAYKRLYQYYKDLNNYKQELLERSLNDLDLEGEDRQKLLKGFREAYESSDVIDPYFPLMRFGDYVLNLGKGKDRVALRFESSKERKRALNEYAKKQNTTPEALINSEKVSLVNDTGGAKMRGTIEGTSKLLKTIYDGINNSKSDELTKGRLKDMAYQAYLQAMPEQSVRKLFLHREGYPGFSSDLVRILASHSVKASSQFARLEYANPMRRELERAYRQLKGNEQYTPFVDRMAEFVSEMVAPVPADRLQKAGEWFVNNLIVRPSFLHSLTSWSSAIIQPADIFLKGIPILAGNHSTAAATAEVSKMLKVWNQLGVIETLPDGTKRYRAPSIAFAEGLTADEREAVRAMEDAGVTRDTVANSVYNFSNKGNVNVDSKGWQTAKTVGKNVLFGGMMHHTERLSREVIFMAAYRLSMKDLATTKMPFKERQQAAINQAISETFETFGNYSTYSRPMIFRGPVGKFTLLYKFFPYVTTKILLGNGLKMLSLTNSRVEKQAAAKKFFGTLLTHLVVGGYAALPAFGLVVTAVSAAMRHFADRDPDAPEDMRDKDAVLWFREVYMPELLGDTGLAKLVERGPINYLTGSDVSSRISLNDMWFKEPAPGGNDNATLWNWALALGGAGPNAALSYYRGFKSFLDGDYQKAVEQLAPGSLAGLASTERIRERGLTTSQGDQIPGYEKGNVPTSVMAGQAIGFRPDVVTNQQNKAFETTAVERRVGMERANISAKLKNTFIKSNDYNLSDAERQRWGQRFQDAITEAGEWSQKNPTHGYEEQEINDLLNKAMEDKANRTENAGIALNQKNAMLAAQISEQLKAEREVKKAGGGSVQSFAGGGLVRRFDEGGSTNKYPTAHEILQQKINELKEQSKQPWDPVQEWNQNVQGAIKSTADTVKGWKQLVTDPRAYWETLKENVSKTTPEQVAAAFNPSHIGFVGAMRPNVSNFVQPKPTPAFVPGINQPVGTIEKALENNLPPYSKEDLPMLERGKNNAKQQLQEQWNSAEIDPEREQELMHHIRDMEEHINNIPKYEALSNWVKKNLYNYVKNEMGTPDDPVRKLADQGVLHTDAAFGLTHPMSYMTEARRKISGLPKEGYATTALGKRWENITDDMLIPVTKKELEDAAAVANSNPNAPMIRGDRQRAYTYQDNPWMKDRPDDSRFFMLNTNLFNRLDFDHVVDTLREQLHNGTVAPENLKNISVPQAVRKTFEAQERDRKLEEQQKQDALKQVLDASPVKQYDNGHKWIALPDPNESDTNMKFCKNIGVSGGWCTKEEGNAKHYGNSAQGRQLYALVDPKGKAHLQIQTTAYPWEQDDLLSRLGEPKAEEILNKVTDGIISDSQQLNEEMNKAFGPRPPNVTEIKPPSNSWEGSISEGRIEKDPDYVQKYKPYIADFLNSGDWGRVNRADLFEHADVYDLNNYGELATHGAGLGLNLPRFIDRPTLLSLTDSLLMGDEAAPQPMPDPLRQYQTPPAQ